MDLINFDVPCDMEETQSVKKNKVYSPKTKSSKLSLDKGFVKEKDEFMADLAFIKKSSTQRFFRQPGCYSPPVVHKNIYKSSNNICGDMENPMISYSEYMDQMALNDQTQVQERKGSYQRKRIKSFHNEEFKLVKLLRKVSQEPTCTGNCNVGILKNSSSRKKERKVSFFLNHEEEEEASVSDEHGDNNFVVTIGDVSPGK